VHCRGSGSKRGGRRAASGGSRASCRGRYRRLPTLSRPARHPTLGPRRLRAERGPSPWKARTFTGTCRRKHSDAPTVAAPRRARSAADGECRGPGSRRTSARGGAGRAGPDLDHRGEQRGGDGLQLTCVAVAEHVADALPGGPRARGQRSAPRGALCSGQPRDRDLSGCARDAPRAPRRAVPVAAHLQQLQTEDGVHPGVGGDAEVQCFLRGEMGDQPPRPARGPEPAAASG
jgi:hypothetical protein